MTGSVLGIGRLFYHSIRPTASEDNIITRKALRNFINESLNKTEEELNNPFAHVDVSNCILTLVIMKALHIHAIVTNRNFYHTSNAYLSDLLVRIIRLLK